MRLRVARKIVHAVWLSFHCRPGLMLGNATPYRWTTRRRAYGRWFPRSLDYGLNKRRWRQEIRT